MPAMTVNWSLHTSLANVRSCVWASLILLLCKKGNSPANKACRAQPTHSNQVLLLLAQVSNLPQAPSECVLALKNIKINIAPNLLLPPLKPKGVFPFILKETFKHSAREVLTAKPVCIAHFQQHTQGLHEQHFVQTWTTHTTGFLLPTCRHTTPWPTGPKTPNQNNFRSTAFGTYSLHPWSPVDDWPSPEHVPQPLHHCKRGKTDLTTGTHWRKGIGATGKNLLAINNQHSDIVLTLFL